MTKPLKISTFVIVVPLAVAMMIETAAAECKPGYVWRDAQDGDGVLRDARCAG